MAFLENTLSWLKNQFSDQEEESYEKVPDTEEQEDFPGAGALPARSLRPLEVDIMIPAAYADARRCVDALEQGRTVIIVLGDNVDDETASRFVDFMSGAVYLAHGAVTLLNDDVLICAPDSVNLTEDKLKNFADIPLWK